MPKGAKPCRRRRQGGKERRENGEKCVYFICLFFPLFFVHLYKHKKGCLFCAYLYVYIKRKKCICKVTFVKCSGWFRYADFRKFCAGLFTYFFCGRQSMRAAGEVCMFICTKKKTKCICLHTQKKEQNAYVYVFKI